HWLLPRAAQVKSSVPSRSAPDETHVAEYREQLLAVPDTAGLCVALLTPIAGLGFLAVALSRTRQYEGQLGDQPAQLVRGWEDPQSDRAVLARCRAPREFDWSTKYGPEGYVQAPGR